MPRSLLRLLPAALVVCFLAVTAGPGLPRFAKELRFATRLLPRSVEERRARALGGHILDVDAIREATAPGTAIDIVLSSPEDRDLLAHVGAALYLRDCRYFGSWEEWRRRERYELFRATSAANHVPGPPPPPASIVLLLDSRSDTKVRVVSDPR
jgi:hypothetical protein